MQAKIQAVKDKVAACVALAESTFGIKMPAIDVRFDLTGAAAGMAGYKFRVQTPLHSGYYLRFNVQHMALGGQTWEHLLNDVVPHEVAHTVCQSNPKFGRQHNAGWKRVCAALGGNGRRVYDKDDAPEAVALQQAKRVAKQIAYVTTSGHTVHVSPIIHSKVQRGVTYTMRGGKGRLTRECSYSTTGAAPTAPVTSTVPPTFNTAPPVHKSAPLVGGSKADMIRAYLAQAKRDTGSEAEESTIKWAIATLGMTRTLARTYVKNNWNKV